MCKKKLLNKLMKYLKNNHLDYDGEMNQMKPRQMPLSNHNPSPLRRTLFQQSRLNQTDKDSTQTLRPQNNVNGFTSSSPHTLKKITTRK